MDPVSAIVFAPQPRCAEHISILRRDPFPSQALAGRGLSAWRAFQQYVFPFGFGPFLHRVIFDETGEIPDGPLDEYLKRLGQRIRQLRGEKSHKVIAHHIGVSPMTISHQEHGRFSGSLWLWIELAVYFKIPVETFLDADSTVLQPGDQDIAIPDYAVVGRRIEELMVIQNYTITELGLILGVTRATVSAALRQLRHRHSIRLGTLHALASGLGEKVSYVLMATDKTLRQKAITAFSSRDPERRRPQTNFDAQAEEFLRSFSERFNALRTDFSLIELADKTGLSLLTLQHLEAATNWPSLMTLLKIANTLKMPPYLFFNRETPPISPAVHDFAETQLDMMGPRLVETIKESGITQEYLAQFIGVSCPVVRRWFKQLSAGKNISLKTIYTFAWAVQRPMHTLFEHPALQQSV